MLRSTRLFLDVSWSLAGRMQNEPGTVPSSRSLASADTPATADQGDAYRRSVIARRLRMQAMDRYGVVDHARLGRAQPVVEVGQLTSAPASGITSIMRCAAVGRRP